MVRNIFLMPRSCFGLFNFLALFFGKKLFMFQSETYHTISRLFLLFPAILNCITHLITKYELVEVLKFGASLQLAYYDFSTVYLLQILLFHHTGVKIEYGQFHKNPNLKFLSLLTMPNIFILFGGYLYLKEYGDHNIK